LYFMAVRKYEPFPILPIASAIFLEIKVKNEYSFRYLISITLFLVADHLVVRTC